MAGTAALGLSRELRTQPVRNRSRTSRRGQLEHKPVAMSPASSRPPRQAHYKRATSCRNKFLIRDRDTKFTAASDEVLHAAHIRTLKSPVQAPPGERDHGEVDRRMQAGTARPRPDLESATSPAGAACVRDPPQQAPAAPLARAGCTAPAVARRRR